MKSKGYEFRETQNGDKEGGIAANLDKYPAADASPAESQYTAAPAAYKATTSPLPISSFISWI